MPPPAAAAKSASANTSASRMPEPRMRERDMESDRTGADHDACRRRSAPASCERRRARRPCRRSAPRPAQQRILVDLAGGRQHEAGRAVARRRSSRADRRHVDRGDARLVAEHRQAERLAGKGGRLKMIEDDVVGRVARLAEFGQHDALLALQLVGIEVRLRGRDRRSARRRARGRRPAGARGTRYGRAPSRRSAIRRHPRYPRRSPWRRGCRRP